MAPPETLSACLRQAGVEVLIPGSLAERAISETRKRAKACHFQDPELQALLHVIVPIADVLKEKVPGFLQNVTLARRQDFWCNAAAMALGRIKIATACNARIKAKIQPLEEMLRTHLELPVTTPALKRQRIDSGDVNCKAAKVNPASLGAEVLAQTQRQAREKQDLERRQLADEQLMLQRQQVVTSSEF